MLDDIRFVMAAVAKKAYVQELTHFNIRGGRITGYNGQMALSSGIGVDFDVQPNAADFLAAVRACEGTISLHVTATGRLSVRDGKFRSLINCLPDEPQFDVQPDGDVVEVGPTFLEGLRLLAPVMGSDASRPWACGIKVCTGAMHATNNVIVAQFWHGTAFPVDVVVPAAAVEQLLRIGTAPTKMQVTPHSVTFWFGEERWLKTNLLEGDQWPLDRLNGALNAMPGDGQVEVPPLFFSEVGRLKPFLEEDQGIYLTPEGIRTHRDPDAARGAVEMRLEGAQELMSFNHTQLTILGQVATHIDWRSYPKPCMFTHKGVHLRGLVIGRRV